MPDAGHDTPPIQPPTAGRAPRLATIADIPGLVAARTAHLEAEPAADGSWIDAARARFEDGLMTGDLFAAVIDGSDGEVIASGVGIVTRHLPHPTNPNGGVGHIHSMYTVPDLRGLGLGRAVLQLLLATFTDRGIRRVELHSSRLGRRLYERAGFIVPERGTTLRLDRHDPA